MFPYKFRDKRDMKSATTATKLGISMGSLPHYPQVFPNRMKISGFVDHSEA
jgi:hypothetical protein